MDCTEREIIEEIGQLITLTLFEVYGGYKYKGSSLFSMMKYLPLLMMLLVSCTPPVIEDTLEPSAKMYWDLPLPTENLTRSYHPADGIALRDSIEVEKEIIQRMNARLECLDGSAAQRIEVVQQDLCVDCYREWVIDCPNDNQFLVVVSEETSRGGFFLFEGRPFS